MALLDLKSDLSKYRSVVSNNEETTPMDSKAKYANNFATYQPISNQLIKKLPKLDTVTKSDVTKLLNITKSDDITNPKNKVDLATLLKNTNKDDFVKKAFEGGAAPKSTSTCDTSEPQCRHFTSIIVSASPN